MENEKGSSNYQDSYIDLSNTYFDSLDITETVYAEGDGFGYKCNYKINIKYNEVNSDSNAVDRNLSNKTIVNDREIYKTYQERPVDALKDLGVTPMDYKEGTVNYAISDFIKDNIKNTKLMLDDIYNLFGTDILKMSFDRAYSRGDVQYQKSKVKDVEFDNRRHETNYITVKYEDGTSKTVELGQTVDDDTVDKYLPGSGLFDLYYDIEDMLEEDYESTVEILNNIFGVDIETLKGGIIK